MLTSRNMRGYHAKTAQGDWPGHCACLALLVVVALSAGIFGFGHHHSSGELLDEHHCAFCQVQQTTIEPVMADAVAPVVPPRGRAYVHELVHIDSLTPRLSPPLRGPPAC